MRNLSKPFVDSMNAVNNSEVFLVLLTLSHDSFPSDIRLVNNNVDITSRGLLFEAVGFQFTFAADDGSTIPVAKLGVDNVDRRLVDIVRTISGAISVNVEIISDARKDVVEISMPNMVLRGVDYDINYINGTLMVDDLMNMKFPADRIVPKSYPGLF